MERYTDGARTMNKSVSEYFIEKHDRLFGEGSWAKMEADVRKRHPEIFEQIIFKEEPLKMWWEFWK